MFTKQRKRFPLLAAGLALSLGCVPLQAEDKPIDSLRPATTTTTSAKQVTLSGKVVDLHQYMTGQRDSNSYGDRVDPSAAPKTEIRPAPTDRPRPGDGDIGVENSDKTAGKMMRDDIMGLQTSTGLVLICFKDAPSVLATPRPDIDAPSVAPDKRVDENRTSNQPRWIDKQVEVSGSMYEKDGIKFLVVTKVTNSSTEPATKTPDTKVPDSTKPDTLPRP